jgi:hypothetical protein
MVLCVQSVEMSQFVKKYDLGLVGQGFEVLDIIKCIRQITPDRVEFYKKSVDAHAGVLCSQNSLKLLNIKIQELCVE